MDKKKIIIIVNILFLFINCENRNEVIEVNFNDKYCDLFKGRNLNPSQHNYRLRSFIDDKEYFFDGFINDYDENIIHDNLIYLEFSKENILIGYELLNEKKYENILIKSFNKNLKARNENLNICFYYHDDLTTKRKLKLIKPIFEFINIKNDSISLRKFKKIFKKLSLEEKDSISKVFNPNIVFIKDCSKRKDLTPPLPLE
jgi:hypothetical protein